MARGLDKAAPVVLGFLLETMTTHEPSPYLPPRAPETPPLPDPQLPPTVIKVLGIIHLVFAAMGVLNAIFAIVGMVALGKMKGFAGTAGGSAAFGKYMSEIAWVSILNAVFSIGLAGLLLVAGLKLLRHRANALRWSNAYAWTSIATKVVATVISLLVVLPAAHRMNGAIGSQMPQLQQTITTASSVVGSLVSFVYPILTLVLLNREPVKRFLASHGT
ncbi:hypothetical protein [Haloferula sargassicola]|uniref:Integral membrane protein n=1 Tax=Haloferula sargassicola TaxID=490096 RepID=A0ABP9UPC3_9BACT